MPRNTVNAGYGQAHQAEKKRLTPIVYKYGAQCTELTCLIEQDGGTRNIPPGTTGTGWHLAHTPDRTTWLGPAHPRCNIAEAQHRAQGKTLITRW